MKTQSDILNHDRTKLLLNRRFLCSSTRHAVANTPFNGKCPFLAAETKNPSARFAAKTERDTTLYIVI